MLQGTGVMWPATALPPEDVLLTRTVPWLAMRAAFETAPVTATGVDELVKVPVPSWPSALSPQHRMPPLERRAQVCRSAANVETAVAPPRGTVTGERTVAPVVPT